MLLALNSLMHEHLLLLLQCLVLSFESVDLLVLSGDGCLKTVLRLRNWLSRRFWSQLWNSLNRAGRHWFRDRNYWSDRRHGCRVWIGWIIRIWLGMLKRHRVRERDSIQVRGLERRFRFRKRVDPV